MHTFRKFCCILGINQLLCSQRLQGYRGQYTRPQLWQDKRLNVSHPRLRGHGRYLHQDDGVLLSHAKWTRNGDLYSDSLCLIHRRRVIVLSLHRSVYIARDVCEAEFTPSFR